MELKLVDGKYLPGEYQGLKKIEGTEELRQRILMRLCTKKGAFLPMPEYGSRLYMLCSVKTSLREAAAKQYVLEALSDERGLELKSLVLSPLSDDEIYLEMIFSYEGTGEFEVETLI